VSNLIVYWGVKFGDPDEKLFLVIGCFGTVPQRRFNCRKTQGSFMHHKENSQDIGNFNN
jgi:hypothetical protein